MNPKEELIRKFCARWSAPSPEIAIRDAIDAAFPNLNDFSPPIRLGRLAPLRKVADISKKALTCDGIISLGSRGMYHIEVNREHPETRRRFTIAHELGHTFFFDVDAEIRERVRDVNLDTTDRSNIEETLCNYAAAHLLMPGKKLDEGVRRTGLSSEGLIRLARNFNVSVEAISRRILQRFNIQIVLIRWKYNSDTTSYQSIWLTSFSPNHQNHRNQLTIGVRDPAFKFFHERDAYRGRIWVSLGGPMDEYFVDAVAWWYRNKRCLLTLFVLDRKPETVLAPHTLPRSRDAQLSLFRD